MTINIFKSICICILQVYCIVTFNKRNEKNKMPWMNVFKREKEMPYSTKPCKKDEHALFWVSLIGIHHNAGSRSIITNLKWEGSISERN